MPVRLSALKPSTRTLIAAALYGAVLVAALLLGVSPESLLLAAVITSVSSWRARRKAAKATAFWSVVWKLRHATNDERTRMLAELEPAKLREEVTRVLAADGSEERVDGLEQFPFPKTLIKQTTRLYWTMWVFSIALLAISAFTAGPMAYRLAGVAVAGLCGFVAFRAWQREDAFQTIIEVTPFRISELHPNGLIRTIQWNQYLELRNEPQRSCVRLSSGEHDEGLALDYRRMAFTRLLELVREYGRFSKAESAPKP
jgi:hypothetical protein